MEEAPRLKIDPRHVSQMKFPLAVRRGLSKKGGLKPEPLVSRRKEVARDIPPFDFEVGVTPVITRKDELITGLGNGKTLYRHGWLPRFTRQAQRQQMRRRDRHPEPHVVEPFD